MFFLISDQNLPSFILKLFLPCPITILPDQAFASLPLAFEA